VSDTKRFNPFRPYTPAPPGMFTGRIHELNRIDDAFIKLCNNNPSNLMIVGERGIGKSSLLLFANYLARGDVTWMQSDKYNFLPIQFSIDKSLNTLNIIKKIQRFLERHLGKEEIALSILKKSWDFIKKIEIASSRINSEEQITDPNELFDKFVYSLIDTVKMISDDSFITEKGIRTRKDGVIFLIDEADNASPDLDLGTFLKTLSEALVIENCNNVMFLITGLPKTRKILYDSHPSSLRLFEELELLPLQPEDVGSIYLKGMDAINKNVEDKKYSISNEALKQMINVSEGYPHFAQQIGFTTFDLNTDIEISKETTFKAIFGKNGAIDLIGDRYYRDMYFEQIKEDSYREILQIMSETEDPLSIISRKALRSKFSKSDQILDNGLKALKDRNIILPVQGKRGWYKFQWIGFGVWIKFFSRK